MRRKSLVRRDHDMSISCGRVLRSGFDYFGSQGLKTVGSFWGSDRACVGSADLEVRRILDFGRLYGSAFSLIADIDHVELDV